MKECVHKVVKANPITGDPLCPKLVCVKCGKTAIDDSRLRRY